MVVYFGECSNGQEIVSGFRFQNVEITGPTEIDNAHIEFTVDGTYSNEIRIQFYGEAADSSHTFSNSSKPSDRPLTMQFVEWHLTPDNNWFWNTKRNSPDIASILQEIVSREGWKSGNAISIIVKNVNSLL